MFYEHVKYFFPSFHKVQETWSNPGHHHEHKGNATWPPKVGAAAAPDSSVFTPFIILPSGFQLFHADDIRVVGLSIPSLSF